MPGADTPLLNRQHSNLTDDSEDLERGLHSGADNDFKHLIDSYPEAVIKYGTSVYSVLTRMLLLPSSDRGRSFCLYAHVQNAHTGFVGFWKRKAWRSSEASTFQ